MMMKSIDYELEEKSKSLKKHKLEKFQGERMQLEFEIMNKYKIFKKEFFLEKRKMYFYNKYIGSNKQFGVNEKGIRSKVLK